MDHDTNVIGAAVLAAADAIRRATEAAVGRGGMQAATLTALHGWADGEAIETLAKGLDHSHSRTVRALDALQGEGLIVRHGDPEDGRKVRIGLTPAGERAARQVLAARARAIERTLRSLSPDQRAAIAQAAENIVGSAVTSRRDARIICRLCDAHACGHHNIGRCPATRAASAADERAGGLAANPSR